MLFSTVVELMSVVAIGLRPSLHADAKATEVGTSLAAFYDKVNQMEPALVRTLVRGSAQRLDPVAKPLHAAQQFCAKGYRFRVLDGANSGISSAARLASSASAFHRAWGISPCVTVLRRARE
ncbi:hypothetical protein [Hyalangium versicolor]|uniref:hypothetical protein n=1 Tax=Hyalangium versicolor TaxID=2861190 RepID=UPI001CCF2C17|nr:hypothetical protein [Hyalangium versicolor]